jgi:hypothetical protein
MNPLSWGWTDLIAVTLAYWIVVAISWRIVRRRESRRIEPIMMRPTATGFMVAFEDEITFVRVGTALLGPPLVLAILLILT